MCEYLIGTNIIREIQTHLNYKICNIDIIISFTKIINNAIKDYPNKQKCITIGSSSICLYYLYGVNWVYFDSMAYLEDSNPDYCVMIAKEQYPAFNKKKLITDLVMLTSIFDIFIELLIENLKIPDFIIEHCCNIKLVTSSYKQFIEVLVIFNKTNIKLICIPNNLFDNESLDGFSLNIIKF